MTLTYITVELLQLPAYVVTVMTCPEMVGMVDV